MAGDWIKMRAELYTHPRFMRLFSHLIADDPACGLFAYACNEETMASLDMPRNATPMHLALRLVTERALREVTMSVLLRVWCAVNSHCKAVGDDAVMSPFSIDDVDAIAGFPGFGDALESAGWLVRGEDHNSLVFPNFLEHNSPACLRKAPLSNAERQRVFRERQKAKNHAGKQRVTNRNESNGREEKRREENTIPPIVPQAGTESKPKKPRKPREDTPDHPETFTRFWEAFPRRRRGDRPGTVRAWNKATRKADPETIVAALIEYAASDQGRGAFVRMATTWLNQEAWTDDREAWRDRPSAARAVPSNGAAPPTEYLTFERDAGGAA